jgi:uncharacterized protein YecE (DUF72 family)
MAMRIGLAGWSYPDWKGRVYPPKPPCGFDPLEYLAGYFDTIEINDYPLVLEVRHRSWDRPHVYELLRDLQVGFCNIDQPQVSYSLGLTQQVTSDIGYLRLHGRNTATWFQDEANRDARYDYLYSATELEEITEALLIIAAQARDVYLIANNHFRGQAALNALDLRRRLTRAPVNVPPQLLTVYPALGQLLQSATSSEGDAASSP